MGIFYQNQCHFWQITTKLSCYSNCINIFGFQFSVSQTRSTTCKLPAFLFLTIEVCWTLKIGKSHQMKLWQEELSDLFCHDSLFDVRVSDLSVLAVNIWCQKTSRFSKRSSNLVKKHLLNLLQMGKSCQIEFWQVQSVDNPALLFYPSKCDITRPPNFSEVSADCWGML